MKTMPKILLISCCFALLAGKGAIASDLDDGISRHLEGSIESDDELGQKDRNVSFIKRNAMSQADVRSSHGMEDGQQAGGGSGPSTGNMNSVVLGVGGTIRGDVVIIDQSRGDKTQVIGR
ncbi:hypothetical protein L4X63_18765 [Geomonas sp. Red32]|uniref:hypothetical protein n=1 Tax=Geomonas sp. Red32 TaxID=2912856 RepID=UPI00202D039F|nr:hypothetical protein [Geomonas sp. Red32]MCM0083632.1 hypothetical protein [Geomonas sp. Red32]